LYLTQFGFFPVSNNQKNFQNDDFFDPKSGAKRYDTYLPKEKPRVSLDLTEEDQRIGEKRESTSIGVYGTLVDLKSIGSPSNDMNKRHAPIPNESTKKRPLIHDDYSDGDISLIIDEEYKRPKANYVKKRQEIPKKTAAKEIFGEFDSNSTDQRKDDKKGFRIKKETKSFQPKVNVQQINPVNDLANITSQTKYKLGELDGHFKKNRLDSRTDKEIRRELIKELHPKEAKENEKLVKQLQVEQELKTKYTTFYNPKNKEGIRSSSSNPNKLQNNFMKTGGSAETKSATKTKTQAERKLGTMTNPG
jgi:predicted subunit of tRNA(5-methylaminomethyl-2-thiouridylate) methyltransferase